MHVASWPAMGFAHTSVVGVAAFSRKVEIQLITTTIISANVDCGDVQLALRICSSL